MTAIAIWLNNETKSPALWAVAYTMVSSHNQHQLTHNQHQLIGDAVKIWSLPIVCRRPDQDGCFSDTYFTQTLGYSFAGSTLMGQNAYLGLSPLLSNIISPSGYIPYLNDIACQIRAYLSQTFDAYKPVAAYNSLFEVALFGHCPRNNRLEIYCFRTKPEMGEYKLVMTAHQNLQEHDFVYLGDDPLSLKGEIKNAFAAEPSPGRMKSRAPRQVLAEHIASKNSPTIGGDLQLAIVDKWGFRPYALGKPRVHGQPAAYFSYLGYELTEELITVGEARVSLTAMF